MKEHRKLFQILMSMIRLTDWNNSLFETSYLQIIGLCQIFQYLQKISLCISIHLYMITYTSVLIVIDIL